jgi:hypothetical protein
LLNPALDYTQQLKPKFDGTMENYDFKFGHIRDNDPSLRIRKGRIALSNQELKPVFDAVVNKILNNCLSSLIKQKTEVFNIPSPLHTLNVI